MKIMMIKLVTGDVVLGEYQSDELDTLTLKRPMSLMMDPMQGGVGMVPYNAIYTQEEPEEWVFDKKYIMEDDLSVHSSFEEAYVQRTTGIETPKSEIIV